MITKETKYYAAYENGNIIEKNTIAEIFILPRYDFIIKKEYSHNSCYNYNDIKTNNYAYSKFKFTIIDKDEKNNFIQVGKLKCTDIMPADENNTIVCKIFENEGYGPYDFRIQDKGIEYIMYELLKCLREVNSFGSWDEYKKNKLKEEEIVSQHKLIEDLRSENNKLLKEISELKYKIELQKSEIK